MKREASELDKIVEIFTKHARTKEQFMDGIRATTLIDQIVEQKTEQEQRQIMNVIISRIRRKVINSTADVITYLKEQLQ